MKFKRYNWKIIQHKVKKRLIGYRLNLFFKSDYGQELVIRGKVTELKDIKTEKIQDKKLNSKRFLKIFKQYSNIYTSDFIEEMFQKNKRLIEKKEIEIVESI